MKNKIFVLLTIGFLIFSLSLFFQSINKKNFITALAVQDVDLDSVEEFSATATENDSISFKFNSGTYLVRVDRVYSNYIDLMLDFKKIRISLRETKNLDLNNDAINDVSITLDNILGNDVVFTVKRIGCISNWYCTSFSNCKNGVEARNCFDLNKCTTQVFKPELTRPCVASCYDNIQNQDETGIDCGGGCQPCKINTKYIYYWAGIPILAAILIIIIALIVIKIKEKPYKALEKPLSKRHIEIKNISVQEKTINPNIQKPVQEKIEIRKPSLSREEQKALKELQDYINEALIRDVSIAEIKENLLEVGWPESVINENILKIKLKLRK